MMEVLGRRDKKRLACGGERREGKGDSEVWWLREREGGP